MATKLNIGLVTTVSGRWPRELPEQRHKECYGWLGRTFPQANVVASESYVVDRKDIDSAVRLFRREGVDLIFIVIGAFSGDIACTRLGESLNVPTVIWAPPEPEFDGKRLMSNALVAATMNNAAMKRLGLVSHFMYGSKEQITGELTSYVRAYHTLKGMRETFLGVVGYRPNGFYSSLFDETLIRKTFGLVMEELDLVYLMNLVEGLDDSDVDADSKLVASRLKIRDLPEDYLRNHSRLYLALKALIEKNAFDALCLRCWPELGQMKFTPCGVLSRFADEGFVIGCELDMNATITMIAQRLMTGETPFMTDLIDIDEDENTALFWHCGQAATSLHAAGSDTCATDHSLAGQGLVVEGTLKTGPVTVARFVQVDGAYKLFVARGDAVPTERLVKGVMVNAKMESPVRDMLYRIAEEGVPHHCSIVWEDVAAELKCMAKLTGVETIEV